MSAPGGVDILLDAVKRLGWEDVRPEFSPPKPIPVENRDEAYSKKARKWCAAALAGKTSDLAAMEPDSGRNIALNNAGLQLYRYVLAGHLDGEEVTERLREAALECGLGNGEIEATLASAQRGAEKHGPQEPPLRPAEEPDPFAAPPGVNPDTGEVADTLTTQNEASGHDYEAFWSSRPELEHIREFARARRCSPWAVLGVTLARVITATPHFVVLPALVGSYASLNLFVALVGPSGGGKGAAESAAGDCLDMEDVEVATVGSGEGIGHLYAHREKGEVVRDRYAVLFTVPEVDNLTALGNRQGATLMPQLRSAWSGEKLGFSYADKNKALPINRHTYRMGLVLGVQPGRAAPLLDDADGGTPQRFLWMPVTDPDAPDEAPPVPKPLPWGLSGTWTASDPFAPEAGGVKLVVMEIPDEVRQQVGRASLDRLRAQTDALDGHTMLARLKVAAALALLNRRKAVSMDDWQLSETIMAVSLQTRTAVVEYLGSKAKQINRQKGEAESQRAILVADRVAEEAVKRVARKVLSRVRVAGEQARSEVRRVVAARDRQYFDEAVDRLIEAGTLLVVATEHGERIKVSES